MNSGKWILLFLAFPHLLYISCSTDNEPVPKKIPEDIVHPAKEIVISLPEVLFANIEKIKDGFASFTIRDRLVDLVDAAPEASTIYICIYQFSNFGNLLSALKRADSRDVQINFMIDVSSHDSDLVAANSIVINELKKWGENVDVVLIDNDAGNISINHNKFILFSSLTTSGLDEEKVVVQTSHNFTTKGTAKIQDAVIIAHDELHDAYVQYWEDMKALAASGMKDFSYREYHDTTDKLIAYFHPKRKNDKLFGGDTIIEILDDITDPTNTTIQVGMSIWTESRIGILEKLEELLDQGATVEVVTKNSNAIAIYDKLVVLQLKGAFVKIFNVTDSDKQKINIHSKFMLIEGVWKGEQTNMVITGSQNYSKNALINNNETTLLFRDHPFYESYKNYYAGLKNLPGVCCP